MKRTPNTRAPKDPKVQELLRKLRELDNTQLEQVAGGMEADRGKCGSHCMHNC